MGGSSLRPRLANLRSVAVTGCSLAPDGTLVPVPARVYTIPAAGLWFFLTRASRSWARISGTVLSGSATVDGPGNLLEPQAVVGKIFWAVFWLIGLGAVALLRPGSSSAFVGTGQS